MLRNLLVLAAALFIAFAGAELGIRAFVTVRTVGPVFSTYDPVYGKRLKEDLSATRTTPEFRMGITTNSLGFRGPELGSQTKGAVIFLGDSFTLGFGVNDGEEYPALVREKLVREFGVGENHIPVVNAGIGNAGNGWWLKFLDRAAAQFEPRYIVLQVGENDFGDNQREQLFEIGADGMLRELPIPPRSLMRRAQAVIDAVPGLAYLHIVGLMQQAATGLRDRTAETSVENEYQEKLRKAEEDRLTYAIVGEALRICERRGWPVIGVEAVVWDEQRRARLRSLFEQHAARFMEAPKKDAYPSHFYKVDIHWTAAGHAYAADALYEELKDDPRFWEGAAVRLGSRKTASEN